MYPRFCSVLSWSLMTSLLADLGFWEHHWQQSTEAV
jgi:hypothetical protein